MDQPLLSSKSFSDKQLRCLKIGLLIYNQPKGKNRKTVYRYGVHKLRKRCCKNCNIWHHWDVIPTLNCHGEGALIGTDFGRWKLKALLPLAYFQEQHGKINAWNILSFAVFQLSWLVIFTSTRSLTSSSQSCK